mmetsp:Transcript_26601/g.82254  ORF Transcript_26601/g.82254 Transcript_26601/m.82254 type:complete len:205 (-) Transcript_26601:16-630(-)
MKVPGLLEAAHVALSLRRGVEAPSRKRLRARLVVAAARAHSPCGDASAGLPPAASSEAGGGAEGLLHADADGDVDARGAEEAAYRDAEDAAQLVHVALVDDGEAAIRDAAPDDGGTRLAAHAAAAAEFQLVELQLPPPHGDVLRPPGELPPVAVYRVAHAVVDAALPLEQPEEGQQRDTPAGAAAARDRRALVLHGSGGWSKRQ